MAGYDVVVVGSVNADLIVRVPRRPGAGETVLGSDLVTLPGGKGANQAVAAARLGARTAFVGRVGDDGHGGFLRSALLRDGVDLSGLTTTEGASGVALITVDPDGDNSIVVAPGANGRVTVADVTAARPLIESAAVVALQLEIPLPAVAEAARYARRVVLNLSPAAAVPAELLALCDPLVVNEHEAAFLLADEGSVGSAAERAVALLELGVRSVVVTLGADGAVVGGTGLGGTAGTVHVSSPRVEVVDTTGAGDAFTGALCRRLAAGDDLVAAAHFAVRVGAAAVRKAGAQSSFPTLSDLESAG